MVLPGESSGRGVRLVVINAANLLIPTSHQASFVLDDPSICVPLDQQHPLDSDCAPSRRQIDNVGIPSLECAEGFKLGVHHSKPLVGVWSTHRLAERRLIEGSAPGWPGRNESKRGAKVAAEFSRGLKCRLRIEVEIEGGVGEQRKVAFRCRQVSAGKNRKRDSVFVVRRGDREILALASRTRTLGSYWSVLESMQLR